MKLSQTVSNLSVKLFRKVSIFTLVIGTVSAFSSAVSLPRLSSDDFGFGASRSGAPSSVAGMSVDQIAQILAERMNSASADQVFKLSTHLLILCHHYRFDPAFILSVIQAESAFKPTALSPAGAVGLMQLMPATAHVILRDMNPPLDRETLKNLSKGKSVENRLATLGRQFLTDPFINLTLGVAYLASLRDRYRQFHPYYVLAAYNMGPARIDELMSKKAFKPDKTKKYFEAIRQGTSQFRLHRAARRPA